MSTHEEEDGHPLQRYFILTSGVVVELDGDDVLVGLAPVPVLLKAITGLGTATQNVFLVWTKVALQTHKNQFLSMTTCIIQ